MDFVSKDVRIFGANTMQGGWPQTPNLGLYFGVSPKFEKGAKTVPGGWDNQMRPKVWEMHVFYIYIA